MNELNLRGDALPDRAERRARVTGSGTEPMPSLIGPTGPLSFVVMRNRRSHLCDVLLRRELFSGR